MISVTAGRLAENWHLNIYRSTYSKGQLLAHSGLRSLIAVGVTLSLMPAWYSQVDSTCFRLSSLKTVPVFRTP
jgi:hypothetical protein